MEDDHVRAAASTERITAITFGHEFKHFKRALFKSKDPFNPYHWIFRLTQAMFHDLQQYTINN